MLLQQKVTFMEKNGLELAGWESKTNSFCVRSRLVDLQLCSSINLAYTYFYANNYFSVNTNVSFLLALN